MCARLTSPGGLSTLFSGAHMDWAGGLKGRKVENIGGPLNGAGRRDLCHFLPVGSLCSSEDEATVVHSAAYELQNRTKSVRWFGYLVCQT